MQAVVITDVTRCVLALSVFAVSGAAMLMQIDMPDWWIVLAGAVAGFYFGMEKPRA